MWSHAATHTHAHTYTLKERNHAWLLQIAQAFRYVGAFLFRGFSIRFFWQRHQFNLQIVRISKYRVWLALIFIWMLNVVLSNTVKNKIKHPAYWIELPVFSIRFLILKYWRPWLKTTKLIRFNNSRGQRLTGRAWLMSWRWCDAISAEVSLCSSCWDLQTEASSIVKTNIWQRTGTSFAQEQGVHKSNNKVWSWSSIMYLTELMLISSSWYDLLPNESKNDGPGCQ